MRRYKQTSEIIELQNTYYKRKFTHSSMSSTINKTVSMHSSPLSLDFLTVSHWFNVGPSTSCSNNVNICIQILFSSHMRMTIFSCFNQQHYHNAIKIYKTRNKCSHLCWLHLHNIPIQIWSNILSLLISLQFC